METVVNIKTYLHTYLYSLLSVQSNRLTRSSDIVTLQRPPVRLRLKLKHRYFTHRASVLRYTLPKHLRQPSPHQSFVNQ